MMEQTMNYVKPELIVVAVVLYFIGMGLKQSQTVKDKYIPLILVYRHCIVCSVGDCILPDQYRTGDCNGGIYSNRTGDFSGWSEYICESGN